MTVARSRWIEDHHAGPGCVTRILALAVMALLIVLMIAVTKATFFY